MWSSFSFSFSFSFSSTWLHTFGDTIHFHGFTHDRWRFRWNRRITIVRYDRILAFHTIVLKFNRSFFEGSAIQSSNGLVTARKLDGQVFRVQRTDSSCTLVSVSHTSSKLLGLYAYTHHNYNPSTARHSTNRTTVSSGNNSEEGGGGNSLPGLFESYCNGRVILTDMTIRMASLIVNDISAIFTLFHDFDIFVTNRWEDHIIISIIIIPELFWFSRTQESSIPVHQE